MEAANGRRQELHLAQDRLAYEDDRKSTRALDLI
jgi:hypothetical protein